MTHPARFPDAPVHHMETYHTEVIMPRLIHSYARHKWSEGIPDDFRLDQTYLLEDQFDPRELDYGPGPTVDSDDDRAWLEQLMQRR